MQKIIIKNFHQITSAEIEIKKILFLLGEQASGKSTVAKLIYFFKSLKEDYQELVIELLYSNPNHLPTDIDIRSSFIKKIQEKFKIYFGYISDLAINFEITFYYNFNEDNSKNRYLTLSKKNTTLNVAFDYDYFGQILGKNETLAKQISELISNQSKATGATDYITLERAKIKFIDRLRDDVNELFYDKYAPMFFPAGRNITTSYNEEFQAFFLSKSISDSNSIDRLLMKAFILHSKFLYDYFRGKGLEIILKNLPIEKENTKNILEFIRQKSEYILKGKYDNSDGNEKIIYGKKSADKVMINSASSGQQESIRIVQDIFYSIYENQRAFRIIEEPEAHLYPTAQKNLIELLVLMINKTNSQLIITTHSPYVLSILNNLLMYSKILDKKEDVLSKVKAHFGTEKLNGEEERINILPNEFQAYSLNTNSENEYCESLVDSETGLIGENFLDNVTEELNNDFDVLFALKRNN
jgi:predicted ATP-dependent endonuclease of OLD family